METSNDLFTKICSAYKNYKLMILILGIFFAFMFGLYAVAPFIDSSIFPWIKNQIPNNNFIALLFDPVNLFTGLFIDTFFSSMVLAFMAWGVVLLVYSANKDKREEINKISRYFNFLTKGPGTLVLMLGCTIIGMSCYGFIKYGNKTSFVMVLISGVTFVFVGFAFRAAGKLYIKKNLSDKLALYAGAILLVLAFFAHTYGLLSMPVQLLLVVKKAYNESSHLNSPVLSPTIEVRPQSGNP